MCPLTTKGTEITIVKRQGIEDLWLYDKEAFLRSHEPEVDATSE